MQYVSYKSTCASIAAALCLCLTAMSLQAQMPEQPNNTLSGKSVTARGYVENKGQITDQNNRPNPAVKYLLNHGGLNVQLRATGFSYDSYVDESSADNSQMLPLPRGGIGSPKNRDARKDASGSEEVSTRRFHRVDIELVGANSAPRITPSGETGGTTNYYTNGKDITGVRGFEKVLYSDIYPNIDLEFFLANKGEPEYQFIVRPGGNPNAIRLRYNGANSTKLVNGKIELAVAHGTISEHIPLSYLAGSKQEVSVAYKQTGLNEYGCVTPRYASNETLVIDPTPSLTWATYYGGTGNDFGDGIALDANGNIFGVGATRSAASIATAGAHQTTLAGIDDVYLVMFNSSGVRQWGTYIGGSFVDEGFDIAVDAAGNVYCTGNAASSTGIATAGAHQTTFGGGNYDAFIVKFNSAGVRQWGTYYGGTGDEAGNAISISAQGDVYIAGNTSSTAGIATTGAHQTVNGGNSDAFIAKFTGSGVRLWGTYLGGSAADFGYGIALDGTGNIYCTGQAASTANISTTGAHQTTIGGGNDAFVTKFDNAGVRQWGTYYGDAGADVGYGISVDASGNIYCTGQTASTAGIATAGAFQTAIGGGSDAFVVKFTPAGVRQWGTYYGGAGNSEAGICVVSDAAGNTYCGGIAQTSTGFATANAHQTIYGGTGDGFLAKFTTAGARQWGTYYGGTGSEAVNGIATDASGNMYCTGNTASGTGISTAGSHQATHGGGGNDAFIAKFFSPVPVTAPLRIRALLQGIWDEATQLQNMGTGISIELRAGGTDTTDNVTPLNWTLTGTTLIGRAAGFCDANGFVDVSIPNVLPDNYWIVVRHGGHLAVASRRRIAIGSTLTEYDFSTSGFKALTKSSSVTAANGATTQGADGKWVLRAGDIIQAAPSGVNANDYAPITGNNGRTSLVPSP